MNGRGVGQLKVVTVMVTGMGTVMVILHYLERRGALAPVPVPVPVGGLR